MGSRKNGEWLTGDKLKLVKGWARDGFKNEEIAEQIGVSMSTFYRWKKDYSEFRDALKEGEIYDREVEDALQKSAMGGTYKEITRTTNKMTGEVIVKETIKEVPPNVTAIILAQEPHARAVEKQPNDRWKRNAQSVGCGA